MQRKIEQIRALMRFYGFYHAALAFNGCDNIDFVLKHWMEKGNV